MQTASLQVRNKSSRRYGQIVGYILNTEELQYKECQGTETFIRYNGVTQKSSIDSFKVVFTCLQAGNQVLCT